MRRTAWDYIWISDRDINVDEIEAESARLEKGKQPEGSADGVGGDSSEVKASEGPTEDGIDESSHWGTDGLGLKVWLRRTIIYQLINLMERIVF